MRSYSIIVPVHNGADRLRTLVETLENLGDLLPPSGEILFADDGSADNSWDTICTLSRLEEKSRLPVRGIRLDENRGQQAALLAAMSDCRGRDVCTMDDDLSHPPEFFPGLLKALYPKSGPDGPTESADLIYANPPRRPGKVCRRLASSMHQHLMNCITGSSGNIRVGSYRAMSAELTEKILLSPSAFPYLSALALGLKPSPRVRMLASPAWQAGGSGRFSLSTLISLEWQLIVHHGPIPRRRRRGRAEKLPTMNETAAGWIAGRTGI